MTEQRGINQRLHQILDYLEANGPQRMQDVAADLDIVLGTAKRDMQRLEKLQCITSKIVHVGITGHKVCTYVRRDTYKPFRESRKAPEKDANKAASGAVIHRFLDKPERPRELRKMNYGWMGYQSGLEAA